jgi:hypothetical protein
MFSELLLRQRRERNVDISPDNQQFSERFQNSELVDGLHSKDI